MHTIVAETDPETSVYMTEYGHFLPDGTRQILTIGSKLMRIFRMNPYGYRTQSGEYEPQIECVLQYPFIAPILAVTKIRLPGFLLPESFIHICF